MIRTILLLWVAPLSFFWSWHFLASNDLSFGMYFFSKALHDQVFGLYGVLLGMDPAAIPGMLAKAIFVDSLIVLAFVCFRRRKPIIAFLRNWRDRRAQPSSREASAESLSSAP